VRVFLTGGSGFVGGAVLSTLIAEGHEVVALARSDTAAAKVADLGAVPAHGDILDREAIASGAAGCEIVFHVAGRNEMCPRDIAGLYRDNVAGAVAVVEAAADAGVRRVVLTSSAAAIGEPHGVVADETTSPVTFPSRYARSKYLGERAAFAAAERRGIELVAVLPASVQGAGRSGGSARLLAHAFESRRPVIVDTAVGIVDVADCAAGHLLAAERGRPGRRYLLCGASPTLRELLEVVVRVTGRPVRPVVLPRMLLRCAAPATRFVRSGGFVCPDAVRTLLHGHRFDATRSVEELGLSYTPLEETIARAWAWLRSTRRS